jgi:hypothetical protein
MRTVATKSQVEAVRRRIARFYECVNHGEFEKCYRSIDPRLLENPVSVTSLQYAQALERFVAWCGRIDVQAIDLQLHLDEPSAQSPTPPHPGPPTRMCRFTRPTPPS